MFYDRDSLHRIFADPIIYNKHTASTAKAVWAEKSSPRKEMEKRIMVYGSRYEQES